MRLDSQTLSAHLSRYVPRGIYSRGMSVRILQSRAYTAKAQGRRNRRYSRMDTYDKTDIGTSCRINSMNKSTYAIKLYLKKKWRLLSTRFSDHETKETFRFFQILSRKLHTEGFSRAYLVPVLYRDHRPRRTI